MGAITVVLVIIIIITGQRQRPMDESLVKKNGHWPASTMMLTAVTDYVRGHHNCVVTFRLASDLDDNDDNPVDTWIGQCNLESFQSSPSGSIEMVIQFNIFDSFCPIECSRFYLANTPFPKVSAVHLRLRLTSRVYRFRKIGRIVRSS